MGVSDALCDMRWKGTVGVLCAAWLAGTPVLGGRAAGGRISTIEVALKLIAWCALFIATMHASHTCMAVWLKLVA
jgi:hypothetical protein